VQAIRVLLTGYADKQNAIRAINTVGLYQYVEKPWDNERLLTTLHTQVDLGRALRKSQLLEQENLLLKEQSQEAYRKKLNKFTKEGDVVVVPGKILSEGEMDHRITVAALSFSGKTKDKLKNCDVKTIRELAQKLPGAKNVMIMG
jgi:response regulator RpfG family c-di-GMP phosphodiesterase